MTPAELNHLRRLVAWINCELDPPPEEQRTTMEIVAKALDEYPNEAAQGRIMESYDRGKSVPKYIRAAITSLRKLVDEHDHGATITVTIAPGHVGRVIEKHLPPTDENILGVIDKTLNR